GRGVHAEPSQCRASPFSPTAHTSLALVPWIHQMVPCTSLACSTNDAPSPCRSSTGPACASPPPPIHTSLALAPQTESGTLSRSPRTTNQWWGSTGGPGDGAQPTAIASVAAAATRASSVLIAPLHAPLHARFERVGAASEDVVRSAFALAECVAV